MAAEFEGKVAIVTGGGRGIGAATARLFAQQGISVVVASRSEDELLKVVQEIEAEGGKAKSIPTDVSDAASVEALVKRTVEQYGRLDFAVNNAGWNLGVKPLVDVPEDQFDQVIAINLKGTFLCMKYEIPAILAAGSGAIVNMSSTAGMTGVGSLAAYVAAKHGVIGLTKSAAMDCARQKIRVNAVAPGPILTEEMDARITQYPQMIEGITAAVPMGRIGQMEEVAQTILWLCSDGAGFITGVTVPVDGGRVVP